MEGIETEALLKRPRSEADEDGTSTSKRQKTSPQDEESSFSAEQPFPGSSDQPPELAALEVGGLELRNTRLATVNKDGKFVPFWISPQKLGFPVTPPIFADIVDRQNPIDVGVAGLISPPTSRHGVAMLDTLPPDFVVLGDVDLFGQIPSTMHIYQGRLTVAHPYTEVVKPKMQSISMGKVIPALNGTAADSIALENLQFAFSEFNFGHIHQAGVHFETDILFQGALQPVSDILRDFFGQKKPALHFHAYMGSRRDWRRVAIPGSLTLQGSLEHTSVKVLDLLEFTQIGIELSMTQTLDINTGEFRWRLDYGFFGSLNLEIPGSIVPLQATYMIKKIDRCYLLCLTLTDEEWTDVFGIHGLTLSQVQCTAVLSDLSKDVDLDLKIEAAFTLNESTFLVTGRYSKDEYALEAHVGNLSWKDIAKLFNEITGGHLEDWDHDVHFDSLSLQISSKGLILSGAVTINGHSAAFGTVAIMRDGLAISGGIGDIEFDHFKINKAQFDVFIGSKSDTACSRATKFAILGDVSFEGIDLRVGLSIQKAAGGELEWMVYGEAQGDLSTSRLCEDLKGTFLDISLKNLALIATNMEHPSGDCNTLNYPVSKGIQLCATIESIPELEHLMRGSVKGMVLHAAYTSGSFRLRIVLPAERTITFSDTVYSGPLALELQIGSDVKLVLQAELNVILDTQPDPLKFALGLKAGITSASAYAQMLTDWINPCNVGKKVIIRRCALEFGIVYTTFLSTGTPGEIGFAGELAIGKKMAAVAMKISQNPKDQLLAATVKDLGVVDLVHFASLVADCKFPEPDDFLHFNDVELYLSTGTTLATDYYPPGASLKGDMHIFGKRASFNCTVGSMIKIEATIEHFQIGPLTVRGAKKDDPVVNIEVSPSKQAVLISGAVEIWGLSCALYLDAQMYPTPAFDFFFDLKLSDLFLLKLQAKLSGENINLKRLSSLQNADFEVYGLMEQQIIEYVMQQLEHQINSAQEAATKGFNDMKRGLDEKEAQFQASCQEAVDELEAARKVWHEKRDTVHSAFEQTKDDTRMTREELQRKVDEAERGFKQLITDVTRELEETRHEASATILAAEQDLNYAQKDGDDSIREAQEELHRTRDQFRHGFGSAKRDLESARQDVENLQRAVDDLDRKMDNINGEIDRTPYYSFKYPELLVTKSGIGWEYGKTTASLQGFRVVLMIAEGIVRGADYITAEGAIGAAELALDRVRDVKTAAVDLARKALEEVKETQNALIRTAERALHEAENASEKLQIFNRAKDAFAAGESVAQSLINDAEEAVDALAACTEFVAFDVSEKALEFAKNNTQELNLARHAVDLAEEAVHLGLDLGKWAASHGGKLLNITKVEFSGTLKGLIADGPPIRVIIQGFLLGEAIDVNIVWEPHFDLVKFIKALFSDLWEMIKESATKLLKELID